MNMLKKSLGLLWFGSNQAPVLGGREIEAMKILWAHGEQSAQTLHRYMVGADISLSTIQSTLERLYRKRLVSREKRGRCYVYQALVDQRTLVCDLLKDITVQLSDGNMAPVVSGFMDFMAEGGAPQEALSKKDPAIESELSVTLSDES